MKGQLPNLECTRGIRSFGHAPTALPEDRTSQDSPTRHLPPRTPACQRHCCPYCPLPKGKSNPSKKSTNKINIRLIRCINKHLLHLPRRYTSARSAQIHHLACSSSAGGCTGRSVLCRFHCSFYTLLCSYLVTDQWLAPRVIKL